MNSVATKPIAEPDLAARQGAIFTVFFAAFAALVALIGGVTDSAEIVSAANFAFLFGFAGVGAFTTVLAVVPRAVGAGLHNEVLGATSIIAWSVLTIALTVLRILSTDVPQVVNGLYVFLATTLAYNVLVTIAHRYERRLYPSVLFAVASVVAAPVALIGLSLPLEGSAGSVVAALSDGWIDVIWLAGAGLCGAFWLIPLITSTELFSGRLAKLTVATLVFSGLGFGLRLFTESPEIEAIGLAAATIAAIPALTAMSTLFSTARDRWDSIGWAPPLRWIGAGLAMWTVSMLAAAVTAVPGAAVFRSNVALLDAWYLLNLGAVSLLLLGGVYYVYPLTVGRHWFSGTATSIHFWGSIAGFLGLGIVSLVEGAVTEAAPTLDPASLAAIPFTRNAAFLLIAVAQFAFVSNAARTSRKGEPVTLYAVATPAPATENA